MSKILTIGIIVAMFSALLLAGVSTSVATGDPWFNASWSKNRAVPINNTGYATALEYYQVPFNITYDSDMQPDFDDIRFVNASTGTEEPYWIEDKENGLWCLVVFNATYIRGGAWSNDTTTIYYANPSAIPGSDGADTYPTFEDYETYADSAELQAVWETIWGADPTLEEAIRKRGDNAMKCAGTRTACDFTQPSTPLFIVELDVRSDAVGDILDARLRDTNDDTGAAFNFGYPDEGEWGYCRAETPAWVASGVSNSPDTWYKIKIITNSDTNQYSLYVDGQTICENINPSSATTTYGGFYFGLAENSYYDTVRVRKYVDPAPTAYLGTVEGTTNPAAPKNLQYTSYAFGVNHTWEANNTVWFADTDSYNISNGTWHNDTGVAYFNQSSTPHGWVDVDIYAYNATFGTVSETCISGHDQVANQPIYLTDYGGFSGDAGDTVTLDLNYTDADGDTGTFGTEAPEGSLNAGTGVYVWNTIPSDWGVYHWDFNVSDGYGSVDTHSVTITLQYLGAFTLQDPFNNVTNDFTLSLSVNNSQNIFFSINSTSHNVTTWYWAVDGVDINNNQSNATLSWNVDGSHILSVFGYNTEHGNSSAIEWEVEVGENLILENVLLLLEEEKMMGLSLLLAIFISIAVIFFLVGVILPNSILTLVGSMTFFITMALPIPMMPDYSYFGAALTSILLLFGLISLLITFYQWFTMYNQNKGYHKWDDYFE